jgi:hypothetical protein
MLRTESGDLAQNITVEALDDLPILGIGNANAESLVRMAWRCSFWVTNYSGNFTMVVNGAPSNASYRIEGQDMTNHFVFFALQEMQPSANAIQEVAVQTSNYSPEFGTAGGGLFNTTMKSGTNQFHGSGYDYFVNEALNAGYPFSTTEAGIRSVRETVATTTAERWAVPSGFPNSTTATTRLSSSSTGRSFSKPARCPSL